jgi:hypothetical protein
MSNGKLCNHVLFFVCRRLFCHIATLYNRNPAAVGEGGGRTYLLAPVRNGSREEQFGLVICI